VRREQRSKSKTEKKGSGEGVRIFFLILAFL
jgi:hypothetical protein